MGHDTGFLDVAVPLPETDRVVRELDYMHFTVLLDPGRRLALATVVDIDGDRLVDLGRSDRWQLDPREPADEQCGNELYRANDLDRGHLVRRLDPVWGEAAEARAAERDTFFYPNAAPQVAALNQGKDLWLGLEDHLLGYAEAQRHRVTVVTGCVFEADDPEYRGVLIPRRFYKVAAWVSGGALRSTAFVLDQSPQLDDIRIGVRAGDVPPLGPFRTFQVAVADVAAAAGIRIPALIDADIAVASTVWGADRSWRELSSTDDILL